MARGIWSWTAPRSGFDQHGVDRVELLVAFNPDSPPRPLQRVASGGETARLTLAIKAVLGESDVVPLMVFDEVDVGLGGRSGAMIGERLARLGEGRQVICITHLPQVAAYATRAHRGEQIQRSVAALTLRCGCSAAPSASQSLPKCSVGQSDSNRASAADLLHAAIAS